MCVCICVYVCMDMYVYVPSEPQLPAVKGGEGCGKGSSAAKVPTAPFDNGLAG